MQIRKPKTAYIALRDRDIVRFPEWLEASGLGRTRGYEIINTGQVESFCIGKLRYVVIESWLAYVDRQRQAQQSFIPGRHPFRYPPTTRTKDQPDSAAAVAANPPLPEAPAAPKRGRGRPRRYPAPDSADTPGAAPMTASVAAEYNVKVFS